MSDYDRNKIRRLDFTLLLIFLGLMRTRKASDVAGELGLTNSSISHAIRRLRDVFEDELFIRRPHGLDPTAFALQIEEDVRAAVDAAQSALAGPGQFSPQTATGSIRIAARDHESATLLPPVLSKACVEAPNVQFIVQSRERSQALRGLNEGTTDLVIGFHAGLSEEFDATTLRTENYRVLAHAEHDIFKQELTLEHYLAHRHVLVSRDDSLRGIVDQMLEEKGLSRQVFLAIPSFFPALSILSESDLIATVPTLIADKFATRFGLRAALPPVEIRSFDIAIIRHRRNLRDPMLSWCLSLFLDN